MLVMATNSEPADPTSTDPTAPDQRHAAAEALIGIAGRWQPGQPLLSEQLITERRAEAQREAQAAPRREATDH